MFSLLAFKLNRSIKQRCKSLTIWVFGLDINARSSITISSNDILNKLSLNDKRTVLKILLSAGTDNFVMALRISNFPFISKYGIETVSASHKVPKFLCWFTLYDKFDRWVDFDASRRPRNIFNVSDGLNAADSGGIVSKISCNRYGGSSFLLISGVKLLWYFEFVSEKILEKLFRLPLSM